MNAVTLKDLQNEISYKADLNDLVAALGDEIKREKKEMLGSKSQGKSSNYENFELRKRVDELQAQVRDLESHPRKEQLNRVHFFS